MSKKLFGRIYTCYKNYGRGDAKYENNERSVNDAIFSKHVFKIITIFQFA